jgi:hypothetical protein
MNWSTIRPLVAKDLKLFFRNRFFAFISIMGLAPMLPSTWPCPAAWTR